MSDWVSPLDRTTIFHQVSCPAKRQDNPWFWAFVLSTALLIMVAWVAIIPVTESDEDEASWHHAIGTLGLMLWIGGWAGAALRRDERVVREWREEGERRYKQAAAAWEAQQAQRTEQTSCEARKQYKAMGIDPDAPDADDQLEERLRVRRAELRHRLRSGLCPTCGLLYPGARPLSEEEEDELQDDELEEILDDDEEDDFDEDSEEDEDV